MLLLDKMSEIKLTNVDRKIADFLVEHQDELKKMSTRDIAKATYTSSSAVIRLAHKLGFEGYNDLREKLIEEQKYIISHFKNVDANIPFEKKHSNMAVSHIMKEVMAESAQDTVDVISADKLEKAVSIISKAKHTYVFGFGAYVPLAEIFKQKMSRIKRAVVVNSSIGEEQYQALMTEKCDCAILISYSGENALLTRAANLLKEKKVPMIVITSMGDNTLSHFGSAVLTISTREKLFSKIANYTSEYSVLLLLNILYSCVFRIDYEKNLNEKINYAKHVEKTHFSTNDMIMEIAPQSDALED